MITKKNIYIFEKKIDYSFKHKEILIDSLIHPSFTKNHKIKKNILTPEFERLEFLGDRVLGLVISSLIYSRFVSLNEGDLSKKLSYLVQKNFLYKISTELSLNKILKFSFKKQNEKMNVSILADAVEALIGAIFIDGGYKSSIKFIKKYWGPYLNVQASNLQDSKTKLQEISQQKFKKLPYYKLIRREGPSHSPTFTISLKVLN
ncbi:uncharacterized protein METZ01_LOCUS447956, partial [marine metagenome]